VAALVLVLGVAVLAVGLPKLAGAVPLTVLSDSMAPAMPVGSLAVVKPTMPLAADAEALSVEEIDRVNDVSGIEPGDVVVFAPEEGSGVLVIHRVLTVSTDTAGRRVFTTKGDNNDTADSPVDGYQVRAVLWYRLPLLGWVNDWLDASTRRAVAVGFAVLAFGWAGWNLIGALRARRARRAQADPAGGEARETGSDAGGGDLLIGRGLL
jgi:signal peptidase